MALPQRLLLLLPAILAPALAALPATAATERRCVIRAEVIDVVTSATAEYLASALRATAAEGCELLLVRVDTPGGALEATRQIASSLLQAEIPVVTYVAPAAARAGSAGVFITMAAHIAAMAPAARIGAAHPVVGLGTDPEKAGGKELARKIESDTAAFARSIAERRGRNIEWAELAVRESVSATASEAVAQNIVDLVAGSEQQLLAALDGRVVTIDGGRVTLRASGAEVRFFQMTLRQRAISVLANPSLAYLLLMIGLLGILLEVSSPGLIVPGAIGVLLLLLAAIGMDVLPVNIAAVLLLLAAVVLFVAELYVTSFGLLALAGLAALLVASLLFIDVSHPDFFADRTVRLSWWLIIPLVLVLTTAAAALGWLTARQRHRVSPTGEEGLLGATGRALSEVTAEGGQVRVHGERWRAISEAPIPAGARLRVVAVRGLTLHVEALESSTPPA